MPIDAWDTVIRVNLRGTFLMSKVFGQHLIDAGHGGSIVNISSIASKLASANTAAYASSKAGINALSHAMAMELAPHKIRVNAICPGVIDTERMSDIHEQGKWKSMLARIPLGYAGDGSEIIACCFGMLSDVPEFETIVESLHHVPDGLAQRLRVVICGRGERVVDDDVGAGKGGGRGDGDEAGVARAGTGDVDVAAHTETLRRGARGSWPRRPSRT